MPPSRYLRLLYQGSPTTTLPTVTAYVAVTTPTTTPLGTITLLSGSGGTSFFNNGNGTSIYVADYYHFPYTTVQVAWASPWEENSTDPPIKSVKDEACRPASLLHFIYANYATQGTPACAQGHSGGASALAYSLAFYGADRHSQPNGYLDTVLLTSGPPLSDILNGCAWSNPTQVPPTTVCGGGKCFGGASTQSWQSCPQYPNGDLDCFYTPYPPGNVMYDTAKSLSNMTISAPASAGNNCNNYSGLNIPTGAYDSTWSQMSLVSGGIYSYPNTFVYGFLCSGPDIDGQGNDLSNNSAAQGWSYLNLVRPSSTQGNLPTVYRIDGCTEPEMIWGSGAVAVATTLSGFQASEQAMEFNCQNLH